MNNQNNYLPGLSGCLIKIIDDGKASYVEKITKNREYKDRLKKQADKQDNFSREKISPFLIVPEVLRKYESFDYFSFKMPYFRSQNFISFFQQAAKEDIDRVVDGLIMFIEYNISKSREIELPKEKIIEKYEDVKKKISDNVMIDKNIRKNILTESSKFFLKLKKSLKIPIGSCHGDLTFSNILFNKIGGEIVLIDWLDNFIETPLQDIVKLRQDTKYYWSLNLCQMPFDRTKILLIMEYIDKRIDNYFLKYPFYKNYYKTFQLLNFLRIFPYAQTESIVFYLRKAVDKIIKNN
jgi:hypothetical protein